MSSSVWWLEHFWILHSKMLTNFKLSHQINQMNVSTFNFLLLPVPLLMLLYNSWFMTSVTVTVWCRFKWLFHILLSSYAWYCSGTTMPVTKMIIIIEWMFSLINIDEATQNSTEIFLNAIGSIGLLRSGFHFSKY